MKNIMAVLLAGGLGSRLAPVSNGLPKGLVTIDSEGEVHGFEHARRLFKRLSIKDVAITTHPDIEYFNELAKNSSYTVLHHPREGNAKAVEMAFNDLGMDRQYLVLSIDTYVSAKDIAKLIKAHRPGTITWGVAPERPGMLMESYGGLIVDNKMRVLGDTTQPFWGKVVPAGCQLRVKGAVQIIDPKLYLKSLADYRSSNENVPLLDLYWQIMPYIERVNRDRILSGKSSIMNAVLFDDDLLDYGTPERLELTRQRYNPKSTEL